MKWIKAILLGALIWVLIFIEISIFQVGLGLNEMIGSIIHYVLLIPIVILSVWLYYKSGDKINGFVLGFVFLIVGVILDLIITIPLFIIPQDGSYASFYSSIYMWIGFVELILISGIYDRVKNK